MSVPSRRSPSSGDPASADLAGQDDATLVLRAKDGDELAFEILVDRYSGGIFRLANRMLGDRAEAEDVTQDTMITAWRQLDKVRDPAKVRSWLYTGATRRCLDLLRRRARQDVQSLDAPTAAGGEPLIVTEPLRDEPGPERSAVMGQMWHALATQVAALPPGQRACWLLREFDGFSYAEIATATHTTEAGVRGQLARARKTLAKGMERWR